MSKTIKVLKVLMVFVMVMLTIMPVVLAAKVGGVEVTPNTTNTGEFQKIGNSIAGIVKVVGIFASVIMLMVIGIKYMTGSAEEKAEYKKVMIPYLIGAILLFAASVFAGQIADWAQNAFGGTPTNQTPVA